jgi:ribulose-phosphate 3-epimerase
MTVMSVDPGFGGRTFIDGSEKKVAAVRALLSQKGLSLPVGADGGINYNTLQQVVKAGAAHLVAGSAVFNRSFIKNIRGLRENANEVAYEGT